MERVHIRFCFDEQSGILKQVELAEIFLRNKEIQVAFGYQIVLDGGDNGIAQERSLSLNTFIEAFFLRNMTDIFHFQFGRFEVGILVHQDFADGEAQRGQTFQAQDECILERIGSPQT